MADLPAITPKWASLIWTCDEHLYLELPGPIGIKSHTVRFPNDIVGLTRALAMLNARGESSKLGTKGNPTQWNIDCQTFDPAKVRKIKPKHPPSNPVVKGILQRLGMT